MRQKKVSDIVFIVLKRKQEYEKSVHLILKVTGWNLTNDSEVFITIKFAMSIKFELICM